MAGIGGRNRHITINKPDPSVNSANESTGWVEYKRTWAEIKGQAGIVIVRGMQENGVSSNLQRYSMRVRFDAALDNTMQVVLSGVPYEVVSVSHDLAGRKFTDLVCAQGGANG